MEIKAPCLSKEAIFFDFNNLALFLDFLETGYKNSNDEIIQIKNKILVIPDIQNDIKDLQHTQETHKVKIESAEQGIFNHQEKILDLEINSRTNKDVIIIILFIFSK